MRATDCVQRPNRRRQKQVSIFIFNTKGEIALIYNYDESTVTGRFIPPRTLR